MSNFSSNNYLGLAGDAALAEAVRGRLSDWGIGAGASRLLGGTLSPHVALERALAEWKGSEEALLFASGYQANVGIIACLVGPEDLVLSDALNHASIIDGCRLSRATVRIYRHLDLEHLEHLLHDHATSFRRVLVVSDSVFSMDGDCLDVAAWQKLARKYEALTLLDEAHATGVCGERGRGLGAGQGVDLIVGTLGKALGVSGAFACGRALLIQYLVNRCRSFIFSTATSLPACIAATAALQLAASPVGDERRRSLWANVDLFRRGAAELGLQAPVSHIIPIRLRSGEDDAAVQLSQRLLEHGVFAPAIRPPTVPPGTARLRFSIMATHRPAQIEGALAALAAHRAEIQ